MSAKELWLDCETSGTDPKRHDILRLAGIVVVNGKEKESFDLKLRPENPANISDEALAVNHLTRAEIDTYPPAQEAYDSFLEVCGRYVQKFNKQDKFFLGGKNVDFDKGFLWELFRRRGDPYLGSWIWGATLEVQTLMAWARLQGLVPALANYQLGTWCTAMQIPLDAHNALSDVRASRELWLKLQAVLTGHKANAKSEPAEKAIGGAPIHEDVPW